MHLDENVMSYRHHTYFDMVPVLMHSILGFWDKGYTAPVNMVYTP
jgi:hypothetical protein